MAATIIPHSPGIYRIICTATGKMYIGSAIDMRKRWSRHTSELRTNRHHNERLQRAWVKYGEETFAFQVIEICQVGDLLEREQYYLSTLRPFDNGFNIAHFAEAPMRGRKQSAEVVEITGAVWRGRKQSKQHIARRVASWHASRTGTMSQELRDRISATLKQTSAWKHPLPEWIEKRAEANRRDYIVTNPDGIEIAIRGLSKFCRENGLSQANMSKVAAGERNHHKGWKCRYAE